MAVAVGTQFQQLCDAIKNYYGAGSDQWLEIAQYGVSATNFTSIVSQVPGVNVTYAKDGSVLGYSIAEQASFASGGPSVAEWINSNTQTGTAAQANTASVKIPASTGVNSQTGNATAASGVTSGGGALKFVTGEVLPAIMATATGITLGKTIDSALYNANPQFWDSIGMSTLNPQTWNSITSDYDGPTVLKSAFNMIFGLNESTGKVQAYASEDAFAYMAQYLNSLGFFTVSPYAGYDASKNIPVNNQIEYTRGITVQDKYTHEIKTYNNTPTTLTFASNDPYKRIAGYWVNNNNEFGLNFRISRAASPGYTNINGNTYSKQMWDFISTNISFPVFTTDAAVIDYILHGTGLDNIINRGGSPVAGVGDQTGATTPTTTGWTDPASAKTSLQSQYPDLWNNAITQDILQPDGTVKTIVYVPVAMPDGVSTGENTSPQQPTSSGDTATQANPQVDPQNTTDSMLQTIIDILVSPDNTPSGQTTPETSPYSDSDTPLNPDQDNPPDTGDGNGPITVLPTQSASALFAVYNPSLTELNSLGAWLWSSNFVDQILKLFNDPMQAIIGLHKIFATPATGAAQNIRVGYLDSGVSASVVTDQYTEVDCGSVNCYEYFGNVFDYDPHTKVHIFLPFIGIQQLNTADVMRSTIGVKYKVDVLTGACLAEVSVTRDAGAGGVLYTYSGDASVRYPISSGSYMGIVSGILSVVGGVAGTIASGGALAPALLGSAVGMSHAHTDIKHSGTISGAPGAMGAKKPYLIISRPQTELANNYKKYQGLPANQYNTVGNMNGYFMMENAKVDTISGATKEEKEEIKRLLENGVYT